MKTKVSRHVMGTFSEISNFIRSFTQMMYDYLGDTSNPYYKWLLEIRTFVRYVSMTEITISQVRVQPKRNFISHL